MNPTQPIHAATEALESTERIGDFSVHPVASLFPMVTGQQQQDLLDSICRIGLQEPIVVHEGLLVDGRNRLRACYQLGRPFHTVEWSKVVVQCNNQWDVGDPDECPQTTVAEWILAKNIARRSLTEDQRAAIGGSYRMWQEKQDAKKRKEKAQFKKGKTGNAGGVPKAQADTISYPPDNTAEKNARSTVGKVAAATGVSHHKAAQVVKLIKAVEAGTAPKEDLELVKAGAKKLTDAVKPLKAEKPKPTLKESVQRDIRRVMDRYAVANHEEVKGYIREELWGT